MHWPTWSPGPNWPPGQPWPPLPHWQPGPPGPPDQPDQLTTPTKWTTVATLKDLWWRQMQNSHWLLGLVSMAVNCTLCKNIIKCFARPEPLPACCERARTKERRYWGEGQQLAKPSRSLLCNFSIKRGDGNNHLHCPQPLQSQDHSPIWSMGRCQPPTPKEGSSCCSSLLTRASLQFFSGNRFYKNYFKMSANTQ